MSGSLNDMSHMVPGSHAASRLKSPIHIQQLQRLKVNRVAISQTLRVEHILKYLRENDILSGLDEDSIKKGKRPEEKAKLLVDVLAKKGTSLNWYRHFRDSLLHPDTRSSDMKKKYRILVEFLDNTINIHPPGKTSAITSDLKLEGMQLPYYEPLPGIDGAESPSKINGGSRVTFHLERTDDESAQESGLISHDESGFNSEVDEGQHQEGNKLGQSSMGSPVHQREDENLSTESKVNNITLAEQTVNGDVKVELQHSRKNMLLIQGFYHKLVTAPENFKSLVKIPEEHFKNLQQSDQPEDSELFEKELLVLERMKQVEVVHAVEIQGQQLEGFCLATTGAVQAVLNDPKLFLQYSKYFHQLRVDHQIDIAGETTASFCNLMNQIDNMKNEEMEKFMLETGENLANFLYDIRLYNCSLQVLSAILAQVDRSTSKFTLACKWRTLIMMMTVYNANFDFSCTDWAYHKACQTSNIFDKSTMEEDWKDQVQVQMLLEMSCMLLEQGSIMAAFGWAQRALKEVKSSNPVGLVYTLFHAAKAYSLMGQLKNAENLSIQAVQQARELLGTYHTAYVKAILTYCNLTNEINPGPLTMELAKEAVDKAMKIYGGPSLLLAEAYQTLSETLQKPDSPENPHHAALKAYQMAKNILPEDHPKIALFRITLAKSLLCHATRWKDSMQDDPNRLLKLAETEALGGLSTMMSVLGAYSILVPLTHILLAQIYMAMDVTDKAEDNFKRGLSLLEWVVPSKSNFVCQIKVEMAACFKENHPNKAVMVLKDIVQIVESCDIQLPWVREAYQMLIGLMELTKEIEEAKEYKSSLQFWEHENPAIVFRASWEELHAKPKPYQEFLDEIEIGSDEIHLQNLTDVSLGNVSEEA